MPEVKEGTALVVTHFDDDRKYDTGVMITEEELLTARNEAKKEGVPRYFFLRFITDKIIEIHRQEILSVAGDKNNGKKEANWKIPEGPLDNEIRRIAGQEI